MGKKLTIDEVKERLAIINPNIEILDDVYVSNSAKMKCRCKIHECGHEWDTTWGNLSQGTGCSVCGYKSMKQKQSLGINFIVNKLKTINPNIVILSEEYTNAHAKLKLKCLIDGHEWDASWSGLSQGNGCPSCGAKTIGNKKRLTISEIRVKLLKINPNIEILDGEYIRSDIHLHLECTVYNCQNKWMACWDNLKQGKGCPECAKLKAGGYGVFNATMAERKKHEWKDINATVYLIKCWNEDELFYKIGVTTRETEKRFRNTVEMPYNYNTVGEILINLYDAIYLEKHLHELNDDFNYRPNIKFCGHRECFSEIKIFENVLE